MNLLLEFKLKRHVKRLGLPVDFKIDFRVYSKTYHARYNPNKKLVIMYLINNKGKRYDYSYILEHTLHEVIHHYQWVHDPYFTRIKGVMHNPEFKELERLYKQKAKSLNLL